MKTQWLRAVLLGASLALLLSGAVALAQEQLSISVDKDCFECYPVPGGPNHIFPPDEYVVELTFDGFSPEYGLWASLRMAGTLWDKGFLGGSDYEPCHGYHWVTCDDLVVYFDTDCSDIDGASAPVLGSQVGTLDEPTAVYGEWRFRLWQEDDGNVVAGPVVASFTFAEDCEAEEVEEFVPEPGTMVLLGSGLAGLAGYATLRWRSRS